MQTTEFYKQGDALPFLRLDGSATAKVGDLIPLAGKAYRVVDRYVGVNGRTMVTKLTLIEETK